MDFVAEPTQEYQRETPFSTEERLYLVALLSVPGVGPVIAKNLIAYCGGPKQVFTKPKGWLAKVPTVGPKLLADLEPTKALHRAEEELAFCTKSGTDILTYLDADYPERLKTIFDAPLLLFKRGALDLNAHPAIAIVGTRKATSYGKEWAERFAEAFTAAGVNVVSGLAYGIDITAHNAVLNQGGITTAVVAHGLDHIYPVKHKMTAERMLEQGAWLSEHLTGTKPMAQFFPARNRILSGMSLAVVTIEAAAKGGALITARLGFEQNREVYALPGPVDALYSVGCNRLIRDNVAKLVTDPQEVLQDLDLAPKDGVSTHVGQQYRPITDPLSGPEQKLLNLLSKQPQLLDKLVEQTGMPVATLMNLLLTLEFKGYVEQQPGRAFIRK